MTVAHRWSVSVFAAGDREVTRDEVVELADAVAPMGGVATGIGQHGYGAQIVIAAGTRDEAISIGTSAFVAAARLARLPDWPITSTEAIGEHEEAAMSPDAWADGNDAHGAP